MKFTPKSRSLVALLGVVALTATACGASPDAESVPSADSATSRAAESSDSTAPPTAPDAVFVPTADGGQLDFNSLSGQDVMLWFWAPW